MDVLMPQLGETVAEGKITRWFKSAGEKVLPGDNLFEIETDKVSMEVPAIEAGVLAEIRVAAGDVAAVGAVVAVISADGKTAVRAAAPAAAVAAAAKPQVVRGPMPSPVTLAVNAIRKPIALDPFREVRTPERNYGTARLPNGTPVTPLARRLAAESGVDLGGVSPSGPHGRIVARDIVSAVARGGGRRPAATPSMVPSAQAPSADRVKALYAPGSYEEMQLDGMRRTIAARLIEAKQTIPHFYLSADVNIERLLGVREEANNVAPKGTDEAPAFKLSVNDFVIKSLAMALQRVPAANAAWAEDRILRFKASDVGVAVAIDGGLITPVIRAAETKSVMAISAEAKDLAARARARKLMPQDYQGGSTTVSNLGMYGVREFSAIINPPQATILAVGAGERRPVEIEGGGVRFASLMTVTLSCDHRVVDGALGAQLLAAFRDFIEHPVGLML
jgi:pyruvate dehydrogenase E2 component (dihydrolipoamide acetyltransferase)